MFLFISYIQSFAFFLPIWLQGAEPFCVEVKVSTKKLFSVIVLSLKDYAESVLTDESRSTYYSEASVRSEQALKPEDRTASYVMNITGNK